MKTRLPMKHESFAQLQPEALNSHETEQSVLSILINYPPAFDAVSDRLVPGVFLDPIHRTIYAELCRQAVGGDFSAYTLAEALDGEVTASEIHAISQCHDHSSRAITRMAQTLVDKFKSRQLHHLSGLLAELAFETTPIQDRIDQAQAELSKLDDVTDSDDWIDAHEAAIKHLDLLEQREAGTMKGIPTGLHDLDEMLDGGMQRGNVVVIGARPAMGKSAIAMTIGLHVAREYSVGLLSMEMPHNDVRDRQAAILSQCSISHIKRPSKGLEFDRIVDGVEKAKHLKFYVSDKSGLNIMQLRSKARSLKRRRKLDVLIVDYIGLMSGMDSKQPRAYQIEEISRGLKGLAKELDIVVMCLAQVNRGAAERAGQLPGLQDLRDSGAIEQDADVVAFIHRPIAANPDAGEKFQNYGLLRVAKNRQGRCGDVHLHYFGEQTRFSSWAGEVPNVGIKAQQGRGGFNE